MAVGAMLATPSRKTSRWCSRSVCPIRTQPLMNEFLAMYPELRIHIELLNGRDRVDGEDLDMVVHRQGRSRAPGWLIKPLMRVRLGLYASPAFLKRHRRPESPGDLQPFPCIVTSCGPAGRGRSSRYGACGVMAKHVKSA